MPYRTIPCHAIVRYHNTRGKKDKEKKRMREMEWEGKRRYIVELRRVRIDSGLK